MRKRGLYSSKTENGSIVMVAGGEKFHGASALASTAAYSMLAALRIGVGYATEFVPRSILTATRSLSPDIIVRPLNGRNLEMDDIQVLTRKLGRSQCLVIGPGIGRKPGTLKTIRKLFDYAIENNRRVIADADAIYALVGYRKRLNMNFIITPNKNEFGLFYKKRLGDTDLHARISAAKEVSRSLNAVVLLKGHETVITDGKRVKVARAGSAALAVMGTGDVLAGIIGGFAANSSDMFAAGVAGAYLHMTIGDLLHKEMGNHILASDVVSSIPKVLKRLDKK